MNDLPHWPAPKLRIALCVAILGWMFYDLIVHRSAFALVRAPAIALVAPEIVELFPWLWGRGRAHVYEPGENDRMYTYGLVNIWMRMQGEIPWFVARDIANALGVKNLDDAVEKMGTTEKLVFESDGALCLSEKGVIRLASSSRNPDAPKFRIWFEREVMFPIRKRSERLQP